MTERPIRRRSPAPPLEVEVPAGGNLPGPLLRALDPDEASRLFPPHAPEYDFAALAAQLQAGQSYALRVPDGHRPRTFYMRLLQAARDRYGLRLHLAKGTGGQRMDSSGTLLFQADAITNS